MYHDTHTRALGLLIQPTGHRAFFWYKKVRGRPTWKTIGDFPDLTVEAARDRASELNARLAEWKARDYAGENPFEVRPGQTTLNDLVDDYIERQLKPHSAHPDRAVAELRWVVGAHLTSWKIRKLGDISREDVLSLHARAGKTNGQVSANRIVQTLRTLYNWAGRETRYSGPNPAVNIKFFHEVSRERFLQPDELARLFAALRSESNQDLKDFVLIALFTGARRGDIFSMNWEAISLADNRWQIPHPKNRKPYTVALTPEVVEILQHRRARYRDTLWVFPSRGKTGHLVNLKVPWRKLMQRANIADLRIHDLRRTLGSWQASQGASLQIIGKSLGHSSLAATQIYSRLNLNPVRESVMSATRAMIAASRQNIKA